MSRREERGSASVHAVTFLAVLLLLGLAFSFVGALAVRHREAQGAADLAALAGAAELQHGGDPCSAAGTIAAANDARLDGCRVAGQEVWLRVYVDSPTFLGFGWDVRGAARAGSRSAGPSGTTADP